MLSTPKTPVQHGTPQAPASRLERMESQPRGDESVPATPKGELGAKRASFIEVGKATSHFLKNESFFTNHVFLDWFRRDFKNPVYSWTTSLAIIINGY